MNGLVHTLAMQVDEIDSVILGFKIVSCASKDGFDSVSVLSYYIGIRMGN